MRISDWSSDVCSSDLKVENAYENQADAIDNQADNMEAMADNLSGNAEAAAENAADALENKADATREAGEKAGDSVEKREARSEEHTSELQSLMRISYAVFCLKKKKIQQRQLSMS